jgi:SAM-dependent methyltransferase
VLGDAVESLRVESCCLRVELHVPHSLVEELPDPLSGQTWQRDTLPIRGGHVGRAGEDVHGEAIFVQGFDPASVLEAGCGTGRVGRELARRGVEVVGVDLDEEMLGTARRKAPNIEWRLADLKNVDLGRSFDAIVLAGNVMIFLESGAEQAVITNMARHLQGGGLLIAGFQLLPGRLAIRDYDTFASAAGLTLLERWSTWDRDPWSGSDTYAVSVHAK